MNRTEIKELIAKADSSDRAEVLTELLAPHSAPVFGAAKVVEHEVAAFLASQRLGYLPAQPDEYDLVLLLRVTKAKARSLLYQVALRRKLNSAEIDAALRQLLSQPRVTKEGDKVMIEVADPLLMDCLRQRVRQLSFISDRSFSGSLAKLSVPALSALIEDLVPNKQRSAIHKKLSAQGFEVMISRGSLPLYLASSASGQREQQASELPSRSRRTLPISLLMPPLRGSTG